MPSSLPLTHGLRVADWTLRIPHYRVRDVIVESACSIVYRAEHRVTGRQVVIKTPRPAVAADDELREHLRLECQALGCVRGPHLVEVLDAGTRDDGEPYLVLEQLEGTTVAALVANGPLPIAASVAIAEAVLDALDQLHAAGFVHRDVNPGNVVLHHERGVVVPKLIDLGVCLDCRDDAARRSRQTGASVGTPTYMAPEQFDERAIDARADVYGVGGLLYETLTGFPPHDGENATEIAAHALWRPTVPVSVRRTDCPPALDALVMRALAKQPRNRPATAIEMLHELVGVRESLALPSGAAALALADQPRATGIHD